MSLEEKLAKLELLLMDVDGVLTDGGINIDDNGIETKTFDVTDGHGLKLLARGGVKTGIITGRSSRVVEHRARELSIEEVHQGAKNKALVAREILDRLGVDPENVAYVGDDVVDLPVMLHVGVGITVADAMTDVMDRADWVTRNRGGRGAVREICEAILKAKGCWDDLTQRYFDPPLL